MRLVADENFRREIVSGLRSRLPDVLVVEAGEVALRKVSDQEILHWAAVNEYLVLTHDLKTLVPDAWERVTHSLSLPGVLFIPWDFPVGPAIRLLEEVLTSLPESAFRDQVVYLTNFRESSSD